MVGMICGHYRANIRRHVVLLLRDKGRSWRLILRLDVSWVRGWVVSGLLLLLLLHYLRIVLWLKGWCWKSSGGNRLRHHCLGLSEMHSRLWGLVEVGSGGWRRSIVVVGLLRNDVLIRIRSHCCNHRRLVGHAFWSWRLFRGWASVSTWLMSPALVLCQGCFPTEAGKVSRGWYLAG